jgi:hypothetical protein
MVACPCGKQVQVPTLRGVQALPRAASIDTKPAAPPWSAQQGACFSIGLCLLLVGLIGVAFTYNGFRQIDTTKPELTVEGYAALGAWGNSLDPVSTLELWQALRDNPLGSERQKQQWEARRDAAQRYQFYMGLAGVVAAVGVALTIAAPLIRPRVAVRGGKTPAQVSRSAK